MMRIEIATHIMGGLLKRMTFDDSYYFYGAQAAHSMLGLVLSVAATNNAEDVNIRTVEARFVLDRAGCDTPEASEKVVK